MPFISTTLFTTARVPLNRRDYVLERTHTKQPAELNLRLSYMYMYKSTCTFPQLRLLQESTISHFVKKTYHNQFFFIQNHFFFHQEGKRCGKVIRSIFFMAESVKLKEGN